MIRVAVLKARVCPTSMLLGVTVGVLGPTAHLGLSLKVFSWSRTM
jgi:hypothetical protein